MTPINEPVVLSMISGTGTGDGKALIPDGTIAHTPSGQPNVIVNVVTPVRAITIRFINAYLTMLVGVLMAGMATDVIPTKDFLDLLWKCAAVSLAGPSVGLLKDLVTIFGKLEQKYPLMTGSV